jgi:hypothetical protein
MARHAGSRLSGIADRRRRQCSQTVRPGKDRDHFDSKGSRRLRRDRAVEQDQKRKSDFLLKREKQNCSQKKLRAPMWHDADFPRKCLFFVKCAPNSKAFKSA